MTRQEIESLIQPELHPAWEDFCIRMRSYSYGYEPLMAAWAFFRKGWDAMQFQHTHLERSMMERVRAAEAIRDDARAASQRYLDEKRQAEAKFDALTATMKPTSYGCGLCEIVFPTLRELAEHTRLQHSRCQSFNWQYRCTRHEDHVRDGVMEHTALGDDGTTYTW